MNNWVQAIFNIMPVGHKFLMVQDKDKLLESNELQNNFESKGYQIFHFDNMIDFRVAWELELKCSDNNILIVKGFNQEILPDIKFYFQEATISLKNIFKRLGTRAIEGLECKYFDGLIKQESLLLEKLNYDQSIKFVLKNLYNIDSNALDSKERLIAALLLIYNENKTLCKAVKEFLFSKVQQFFNKSSSFNFPDEFENFIENQWKLFLEKSPEALNFDEPMLQKEMNCYITPSFSPFKEKKLEYTTNKQIQETLSELENILNTGNQKDLYKPEFWFDFIKKISSIKKAILESEQIKTQYGAKFSTIEQTYNSIFQDFIEKYYKGLLNRSTFIRPFIVSQILNHFNFKNFTRLALIVIDGMNFWQWLMLENILIKKNKEINILASACFAWIPTITAYSRQAIFKGGVPDMNKDSSYEKKFWNAYWTKQGLSEAFVMYSKIGLKEKHFDSNLSGITRLGLVCNDIDEMMHGAVLVGDEMLFNSTSLWLNKVEFLLNLIDRLFNAGFKIFITSDHGSIEAKGERNLRSQETFGSISRSKRFIKFANNLLADNFIKENSKDINLGKLEEMIYIKDKHAFYQDLIVTHGGSHFWEVIVPFVEIGLK